MIGVVYFIRAGRDGPIKIGYTGSLKSAAQRLADLQTGNPAQLVLLAARPGTEADERDLHHRFREHRVGGEWFWPAAELLEEIGLGLGWDVEWEEVLTRRARELGRKPSAILQEAFWFWLGYMPEDLPLLHRLPADDEATFELYDRMEVRKRGPEPLVPSPNLAG